MIAGSIGQSSMLTSLRMITTPVTCMKKALGLDLANLTDDLRKKHNIKDKVKGVVITGVDPNSPAAEKRLAPGMVIAEVQQQPVSSATELNSASKDSRKTARKQRCCLWFRPTAMRVLSRSVCNRAVIKDCRAAGATCTGRFVIEHVTDHAVGELGSNQVDFGGMIPPASATAIRSPIRVG